ncbi:NAD(P)/FAD-dependent oxidoreductase [Asticcacaulis benevestitus]|nr:FAD-dependent oxidoreductase [Asticcacaulis benevestitus]
MIRITILGSGFGALTTVRQLRKRGVDADITIISPTNELLYYPSLIWVPAGLRHGDDLKVSLSNFFRQHKVIWHKGAVQRVVEGGRLVETDTGDVSNDILIVASGGRYIRKLPGIENAVIPCEGVLAAEIIRDRLAQMQGGTIAIGFATNPNELGAVRGGPMFEFLFGLDTLLRRQGRRHKFKLVFFNPSTEPGQRLGPKAVSGLLKQMTSRQIETRLGHKMVRIEPGKVVTEGGEIPADLVLFMPGLTGPAWLEGSELSLSAGGFIQADAACRAEGVSQVYVVGDAGSYPGPDWMAKQAHQADLQAEAVAHTIKDALQGQHTAHDFKSELICIVDTLDAGILVFRDTRRNFALPRLGLFHWMKVQFEAQYLKAYR